MVVKGDDPDVFTITDPSTGKIQWYIYSSGNVIPIKIGIANRTSINNMC